MSADEQGGVQVQPQTPTPPAMKVVGKGKPGPKPKAQKPSVGRIVRYRREPDGEERAAIIVGASDESTTVDLLVLNVLGVHPVPEVPYDADGAPVTWGWPPRD